MSEKETNQTEEGELTGEELSEILQVRRDKLKYFQDEGRDPFVQTRFDRTAWSADILAGFDRYDGQTVSVAGRIMSKRGMGKAIFCHIKDDRGRIQLYIKIDAVSEQEFADFRKYDVGDIVGVTGYVFKTKTGEVTVHVQKVVLLSKSLRPLPEKFHGMTNVELKYRQRYVDLIMSDESRRNFEIRSKFVGYVRRYLDGRGYMEVETPVLNTISGGATARPFITHHNTLDMDMYLRIATELNLKRLIVGGIERVYEIGRIFRNEGMDTRHNPEFTTVELYEAYGDLYTMMDLFEELLSGAAREILGTYELEWQGEKLDLTPGWKRVTMADAVKEYTGVDFMSISDDAAAVAAARAAGADMSKKEPTWGNALYETFDQLVEDKLVQPTFVTAHPVDVSPLAKRNPGDPRLTERFELFICRSEMGNAFSELNDPIDQKARFQKQVEMRAGGDDEAGMMDEDFINALEYGMPPTGGLGIGIDRCVMLLTGCNSIRDVILFPTMKPLEE
jgi:lysyl-tRNA synthetase class 2